MNTLDNNHFQSDIDYDALYTALLAAGSDPYDHICDTRDALMEAARRGEINKVRAIIKHFVTFNIRYVNYVGTGPGHMTALMEAAVGGNGEVVRALLDAGAAVNYRTRYAGRTALLDLIEWMT